MLTAILIVLAVLVVLGAVAAVVLVCGMNDGSCLGWFISWQATEAIVKVTLYVLGVIFQAIASANK